MNRRLVRQGFIFLIVAAPVSVVLQPVHSSEHKLRQYAMFASPQMNRDDCGLVERYSKNGGGSTKIQGYLDEYGCNVSLVKERYEKLFRYCYQSGINVHRISSGDSFECFIQERESDYLFLSHITKNTGRDSQVMCYFSCISR